MKQSSLVIATALVSALAASPVLAQSSNNAASGTHPSTATTSGSSAGTSHVQFWTESANGNEWRASKLKGLSVYNQNNEKLGDIDDVLVDKSGQVKAVVIGVGGFLGLGEHNVAVPFDQLQFVYNDNTRNNTAGTAGNTMSSQARDGVGNPSTNAGANTGLGSPAVTTPNSAATNNAANRPATTAAAPANRGNNWAPDRAILNATKDELKNAPQFKYNG